MARAEFDARGLLSRRELRLGGVELELYEGGSGPPLVFLHGGAGFEPAAPFVAELCKSFRVFAPSHPGFGRSSLPDWIDSIDDFAYVHIELMARLDIENALLIGHSIGGWTATAMAVKNIGRIGKLVLVAPVGIKIGGRDRLDIPDIFALSDESLDRLRFHAPERWRLDPAGKSDEELLIAARNRETLALVTWEPYMHDPKLRYRLHLIDRPTLVLRGASDGLVSREYAEAYAALVPGARLETIAEAGHLPQIEQPELFVAAVERFTRG